MSNERILEVLARYQPARPVELAFRMECGLDEIRQAFRELRAQGKVERETLPLSGGYAWFYSVRSG